MNPKPFARTGGRDAAHDRATGADVALGRGRGNSTAVFGQAAARLGATRVVSLCMSPDWDALSRPRLQQVVEPSWLDRIDARVVDILAVDYADVIGNAERVLLVWDAHGFEIAELVLGDILPRLADRAHLVLMHDISDNRYSGAPRSYEGQPLWKGSHWQQRTKAWGSRVNLGWMNSIQDQVIALADFSARNDLEIGSADHEYAMYFEAESGHREEMRRTLGDEFFSLTAHWAFLSLEGRQPPFHFPAVTGRQAFTGSCAVALVDTSTPGAEPLRLPFDVVTPAAQWAYGATLAWTPQAPIPEGAQPWLRLRLLVRDAPIGVGLLDATQARFIEQKLVTPAPAATDVLLPMPSRSGVGPVVIFAWSATTAVATIELCSVVW